MNTTVLLRDIERAGAQALIFEIAITLIVLIVAWWLTYWCIKNAVRDGIKEATPRRNTHERPAAPPGYKWALVKESIDNQEMRAD